MFIYMQFFFVTRLFLPSHKAIMFLLALVSLLVSRIPQKLLNH